MFSKRAFLLFIGALSAGVQLATAELPAVESTATSTEKELPVWGVLTDPDGDCRFVDSDGVLLIHVPGSAKAHDLAAEIHLSNAPRALQKVRGNFTIQVQVDGRFGPSAESAKEGRVGYNGAGLTLVADPGNVVTLARAVLRRNENDDPAPYANFEMRADKKLRRIGMTGDHPLPKSGPIQLRLERRGSKVSGYVSVDGAKWDLLQTMDLPADWPEELQVGVIAISTSREEFDPRFSKLQLGK